MGVSADCGADHLGKPLIVQEADGRKGWERPLSQVEGRGIDVGTQTSQEGLDGT